MTHWYSDQALISSAHLSTPSARRYQAVYKSGTVISFAAGHSEAARIIAREYGQRMLNQDTLVSCKWER